MTLWRRPDAPAASRLMTANINLLLLVSVQTLQNHIRKQKTWRNLSESKDMQKPVKSERYAGPEDKTKDRKSISKNERWAKAYRKLKDGKTIQKLKDGQNYH
jgi:hypothetical protein